MNIGPVHFAYLAVGLFAIGVFGVVSRASMAGRVVALVILSLAPLVLVTGVANGDGASASGVVLALVAVVAGASVVAVVTALGALLRRRTASDRVDPMEGR